MAWKSFPPAERPLVKSCWGHGFQSQQLTPLPKVAKLIVLTVDNSQHFLNRLHGRIHEIGHLLTTKLRILLLGVLQDSSKLRQLTLDRSAWLRCFRVSPAVQTRVARLRN